MTHSTTQARRGGFTLVELLLGLAIGALLMVGIGYALQASVQSVQANVQVIEGRQRTSISVNHMLGAIRRAGTITLVPDTGDSAQTLVAVARNETPEKLCTTTTTFALAGSNIGITTQAVTLNKADGTTTTEVVANDAAIAGVKQLTFTAPRGADGVTRRKVTINLMLSVPDQGISGDLPSSSDIPIEASAVARGVPHG